MRGRNLFTDKQRKLPQLLKKSCPYLHPSISSPPKPVMNQQQFNFQYTQFTTNLPIIQQVKDNLKYLYQLYWHICQLGGLVSVLINQKFGKIIQLMSIKFPQIVQHTEQNILEHYVKFQLFSFQIVLKTGKRLENDKLVCLQPVKCINGKQINEYLDDLKKGVKLYDEDIVLLRQFCSVINFQDELFNVIKIKQRCANDNVKILIQVSDQNQFNKTAQQKCSNERKIICQNLEQCPTNIKLPGLHKLLNQQPSSPNSKVQNNIIEITFNQFYKYYSTYPQSTFQQRHQSFKLRIPSTMLNDNYERVMHGVQLDPKDDFYLNQMHKKLKGTFLCFKQSFDFLSNIDEDISAVTLPYFDFQLEGNWCGGGQQNFGMAKVDFNLGQSVTQWYCISADNLNKLQTIIRTEQNKNLQKIEGEWFEDIDWFIERKIQIKKVVQKPGDVIIIGSGSLYWYKSKGKSIHISWSIMPKSEKQIKSTLNRISKLKQLPININADFINENKKIPFKSILLRVLNHQQYSLQQKQQINNQFLTPPSLVIIRQSLRRWYIEEQKGINQLIVRRDVFNNKFKHYYIYDAESFCGCCGNQILNYFMNNNGLLSCLQCICKNFVNKKQIILKDNTIYYKYETFWLYQLIYYGNCRLKCEQRFEFFAQFQQICQGQFNCLNQNCCKNRQNQSKYYKIQDRQEWDNTISSFIEKQCNTYQNLQIYKIQTLILKNNSNQCLDKMQEQNLPFHICTQTNLSIPFSITDQQIMQLGTNPNPPTSLRQNNFQFKDADTNQTCVSRSSILRKAKRALQRESSEQKSDTQISDEMYQPKHNYYEKSTRQKLSSNYNNVQKRYQNNNFEGRKRRNPQESLRNNSGNQKQRYEQKNYIKRQRTHDPRTNYNNQRQQREQLNNKNRNRNNRNRNNNYDRNQRNNW